MAGPFKFGMQKTYRKLDDMDSREGERKKALTTLKKGDPSKKELDSVSKAKSKSPAPADDKK